MVGSWTTFAQLWLIGQDGNVIAAMPDLCFFFFFQENSEICIFKMLNISIFFFFLNIVQIQI